jgi:hypothetical protein
MKKLSIEDAIDIVQRIHDDTNAANPVPSLDPYDSEGWRNYRKAQEAAVNRLVEEHGAKFRLNGAHDHNLRLAGVSSSSTSGHWGMINNWLAAASRKLAKQAQ